MGILPKAPRLSKRRSVPGANKSFYNSSTWKKIRELILLNEPLCRECRMHGKLTEAIQVDHIIPIGRPGVDPTDMSNLQPLCFTCHGKKSGREQ